jgi:hypothetical protein
LGVTPLADNHKSDPYFYQILVFTGQRTNAGTESKVRFQRKSIHPIRCFSKGSFCLIG